MPQHGGRIVTDKPEMCPFDPDQPKADNCKYGDDCPWFVDEGNRNEGKRECFCAVGETPDLMLKKMLAAKVEREE